MDRQLRQELSPFYYLRTLEQAILSHSKSLPRYAIKKDDWVGIAFVSGALTLLTPLEEVEEILTASSLAVIPGVKPWLRGMATRRGEVFPVTDLPGFLKQKISLITKDSRILIMKFQGELSGLLVDKVLGLQHIANQKTQLRVPHTMTAYAPFIVGLCVQGEEELPIISCKAIVQHPGFNDVALKADDMSDIKGI